MMKEGKTIRVPAGQAVPPQPYGSNPCDDARIERLIARHVDLFRRMEQTRGDLPDEMGDELSMIENEIANTPAATLRGLRAKGRILAFLVKEDVNGSDFARLANSVLADIERFADAE